MSDEDTSLTSFNVSLYRLTGRTTMSLPDDIARRAEQLCQDGTFARQADDCVIDFALANGIRAAVITLPDYSE